jgi:hypothetical protein
MEPPRGDRRLFAPCGIGVLLPVATLDELVVGRVISSPEFPRWGGFVSLIELEPLIPGLEKSVLIGSGGVFSQILPTGEVSVRVGPDACRLLLVPHIYDDRPFVRIPRTDNSPGFEAVQKSLGG